MNILTFDIEEWFHFDHISGELNWDKYESRVEKGTDKVLNALSDRNQNATFFCMGWIAQKYPNLIRKIHVQGHQIGCHSDIHELVTRFNREQFKSDTERAIKSLEDLIGNRIDLYRAPAFSITEKNTWAFDILYEQGIRYDCSIFPGKHEYGGFPSFGESEPAIVERNGCRLKEFPINMVGLFGKNIVFSGGGYFRLIPYEFIRYWMKQSDYVMTYFHPRDFDPDIPIMSHLPIHRKFKSYIGLKRAFGKFERLMDDFDFVSVSEADKSIDWQKVKTVEIA